MNILKGSKYEKYVAERLSASILETENGFIVYNFQGKECFIVEMFVEHSLRQNGEGKKLISDLCQIALDRECELLTANVYIGDKNANNTLMAAFKVGFKVGFANNNCISLYIKLGEK